MKKLLLAGLVTIAAATLAAVGSAPCYTLADQPQPVTRPLKVVLDSDRDNGRGGIRQVAPDEERIPAIARNPIALGEKDPTTGKSERTIKVGSVSAYSDVVEDAIAVWNDCTGATIFGMQTTQLPAGAIRTRPAAASEKSTCSSRKMTRGSRSLPSASDGLVWCV